MTNVGCLIAGISTVNFENEVLFKEVVISYILKLLQIMKLKTIKCVAIMNHLLLQLSSNRLLKDTLAIYPFYKRNELKKCHEKLILVLLEVISDIDDDDVIRDEHF